MGGEPDAPDGLRRAAGARIEVGYVARAHGIRGEIAARPHDPASETLATCAAVWIDGRRYEVVAARETPKGVLLALGGVDDRNAAEALRGRTIEVDRAELGLAEGDVLVADLVGCRAQLADGTPWGTIVAIDMGPQYRLVIHDGDVEREVPLVDELVPAVDLDARVVTIAPPDELPEQPIPRPRRR